MHLEPARGVPGFGRKLLGRAPYLFPNVFTPTWMIEGLAVYEETEGTAFGRGPQPRLADGAAHGRPRGATSRARTRRSTASTDWPGGQASYLFGEGFLRYLSDAARARHPAPAAEGPVAADHPVPRRVDVVQGHGGELPLALEGVDAPRASGGAPARRRRRRRRACTDIAGPHHARHSPDGPPLQPRRRLDRVRELQPHPLPADPPGAPGRHRRSPASSIATADRRLSWTPGRQDPGLRRDRGAPHLLPLLRPARAWTWRRAGCGGSPAACARASPTSRPTAARVVFVRKMGDRSELFVVGLDGTGLRALTTSPPRDRVGRPSLQPRRHEGRGLALDGGGMARHRDRGRGLGRRDRAHPRSREGRRAHLHPRRRRRSSSARIATGCSNLYAYRFADGALVRLASVLGGRLRARGRAPTAGRSPSPATRRKGYDVHTGTPRPRERRAGRAFRRPLSGGRPRRGPRPVARRARIDRSTPSGRASGRPWS